MSINPLTHPEYYPKKVVDEWKFKNDRSKFK